LGHPSQGIGVANKHPTKSLEFEGWAQLYTLLDLLFSRVRTRVVEITAPREGSKVLDLGTGTGGQAFAFGEKGFKVVAVDLSEKMLSVARRRNKYGNVVFKKADATSLPFRDSFFDVSCVSFVLHEVDHQTRERILAEMSRVTKPGGTTTIVDYALPKNPVFKHMVFSFVSSYENNNYPNFLWSNLVKLMEKKGIRVEEKHSMFMGTIKILRGIVTKPWAVSQTSVS